MAAAPKWADRGAAAAKNLTIIYKKSLPVLGNFAIM